MLYFDHYTIKHLLIIFEIIANSGSLTALECTVFGRGSALDLAGELIPLPRFLAGLRGPNFKGDAKIAKAKEYLRQEIFLIN